MSKRRYTITTLQAGQLRAYADTTYVHQIMFEWQGMEGFKNKDAPFVPNKMDNEEIVRYHVKHFSGWTEDSEGDWASTRLEYLKRIDDSTWEWKTRAAFTD